MFRSGLSRLFAGLTCLTLLLGVFTLPVSAEDDHGDAPAAGEKAKATDEHAGDAHPKGVPLDPKKDLALWSGVVFVIFLIVLRVFAWKPLTEGLDARESGIRRNIADAESNRLKSETLLAQHQAQLEKVQEQVRQILAEARRDADQAKQNIIHVAEQEADAIKQRATSDIERARDAALKDIFNAMADRVAEATEHVLGRALNDDDQKRLVAEALEQVSAKS